MFGSIAQLVQSVCLTSRGSGVRLPLLPPKTPQHIRRGVFLFLSQLTTVSKIGNAIRRYQISNEKPVQESERASVDSYLRFGEISHLAVQRDTITKHY